MILGKEFEPQKAQAAVTPGAIPVAVILVAVTLGEATPEAAIRGGIQEAVIPVAVAGEEVEDRTEAGILGRTLKTTPKCSRCFTRPSRLVSN